MNNQIKLLILAILSSLSFFNPLGFIQERNSKAIMYVAILLSIILSCFKPVKPAVKYPSYLYKLLAIGVGISVIMPYLYQKQGLIISLQSTLPFIFSLLYVVVLIKSDIPIEKIEKVFVWMGILTMFVFAANLFTAPNYLFGEAKNSVDMSRGIARIRVPMQYIILSFFLSLNRFVEGRERKWLYLSCLSFLFIVLSVTRQYIAFSALFGVMYLMRSVSWKKKIIVFATVFFIAEFVLPQIPIFQKMQEVSEEQKYANKGEDDIRIREYYFYLFDAQANDVTAVWGNGIPSFGNSQWGNYFEKIIEFNHCYSVDIGWGGFYFHFGLLTTLVYMLIFFFAIRNPKHPIYAYTTYYLMFMYFSSFISGPVMFYHQILSISIVNYIVYKQNGIKKNSSIIK